MRPQRGQAMVEMVVIAIAILTLVWGLLWLLRWQQIKTQTQHYASLQAFRFSQSYELDQGTNAVIKPLYLSGLFSTISHKEQTETKWLGAMPLSDPLLTTARNEGLLGLTERWRFTSKASAEGWNNSAWAQNIFDFVPYMKLQSQTSIWIGAGHVHHDQHAIERIQASPTLWASHQKNSALAIRGLSPLLIAVDAGWGRSQPTTYWLKPWQESVPPSHLK